MLKRITYQVDGQPRSRCFRVIDGELSPVDCPPSPPVPGGLGDLVADGTKALGVKPCGKCRKRQAWLNRVTPGWMKKFLTWMKSL
jgi:hypothetical protein